MISSKSGVHTAWIGMNGLQKGGNSGQFKKGRVDKLSDSGI